VRNLANASGEILEKSSPFNFVTISDEFLVKSEAFLSFFPWSILDLTAAYFKVFFLGGSSKARLMYL